MLPTAGAKDVDARGLDEVVRASSAVVRPRERSGAWGVDFRAGADVADLAFHQHGRVNAFEHLNGLLVWPHILVKGQRGKIPKTTESNPAFTASTALASECVWSALRKMG